MKSVLHDNQSANWRIIFILLFVFRKVTTTILKTVISIQNIGTDILKMEMNILNTGIDVLKTEVKVRNGEVGIQEKSLSI